MWVLAEIKHSFGEGFLLVHHFKSGLIQYREYSCLLLFNIFLENYSLVNQQTTQFRFSTSHENDILYLILNIKQLAQLHQSPLPKPFYCNLVTDKLWMCGCALEDLEPSGNIYIMNLLHAQVICGGGGGEAQKKKVIHTLCIFKSS